MNLRVRVTTGFLVIVLVMVGVAATIIWQEAKMNDAFQQSSQISEIEKYYLECRRQEKNYLIRLDDESILMFGNNMNTLNSNIDAMLDVTNDQYIAEKLNALKSNIAKYNDLFRELTVLDKNNIDRLKIQNEVELARLNHTMISDIKTITAAEFEKAHSITNMVNLFSIIIGLFLSVVIAGFISTKLMDYIGISEN